jgi:phosphomannomutase
LLSFLHLVSAIEQSGGSIEQAREMCLEDGQCLAEATIENLSIDQATHQLDARFGRYRVSHASQHTQVVFGERDQWRVTLQPSKTERALRMNVEAKKADRSLEALGYDFLQSMQATTREPLAAL